MDGKKSWKMQGEVDTMHRPKGSLLDLDLEFRKKGAAKCPSTAAEIEEVLKERIRNKAFDDPVEEEPIEPREIEEQMKILDALEQKTAPGKMFENTEGSEIDVFSLYTRVIDELRYLSSPTQPGERIRAGIQQDTRVSTVETSKQFRVGQPVLLENEDEVERQKIQKTEKKLRRKAHRRQRQPTKKDLAIAMLQRDKNVKFV